MQRHIDRVLQYLKNEPPRRAVVSLRGSSAARECTISDRDWRRHS
jgi:hypothetical protein